MLAKLKEDEARKASEAASKVVKEGLLFPVQESINTQYSRLEELKRRLEALNPNRSSTSVQQTAHSQQPMLIRLTRKEKEGKEEGGKEQGQRPSTAEGESKARKKPQFQGRGRGIGITNSKGRGGWTGAGFDVDGRT
ncbi:unnamed protein product [Eruca vesicaria subsp. sativa]|uniref:Uncharacterized protein n=1 Tax=Eruca vesicaria subsp. sativa TaxID=29727 RepID=A0ABC8MBF7_ERUVS|nr:unnamed protein product [Eruca vesicaria subsp. sativa]